MSKHTPGPWSRDKYGHIMASGKEVNFRSMSILRSGPSERIDEAQANTTLAASAPDLLEALIEVSASLAWNAHGECRGINDGPIMPSQMAIDTAKKAIAKARGEA